METLILPCNHASLISNSVTARQIRILGNLSDFFKQVWIPNKFKSNSKSILLPGFLIQLYFEFELDSKRKIVPHLLFYQHANSGKFWSNIRGVSNLQLSIHFGKYKKLLLMSWARNSATRYRSGSHHFEIPTVGPPVSDPGQGNPARATHSPVRLDADIGDPPRPTLPLLPL
jgi:hypothetical protein